MAGLLLTAHGAPPCCRGGRLQSRNTNGNVMVRVVMVRDEKDGEYSEYTFLFRCDCEGEAECKVYLK